MCASAYDELLRPQVGFLPKLGVVLGKKYIWAQPWIFWASTMVMMSPNMVVVSLSTVLISLTPILLNLRMVLESLNGSI